MNTTSLHTKEGRLEEGLRAAEPLIADGDDLSVGKFVGLLQGGGGSSSGHLLLKVQGNIAELLLDVPDNLPLGSGGERVASLSENLHQVVREVTACKVQPEDGVGQGIALVDGDGVGHTISRVKDNTGGTAGGIQGEHSLDGNVHGRGVECLEHDLCHLLPVGLGVERGLCQQDGMLLRGDAQLVVEGVVPDLLHVVPVGDDSMLDGILEGQDTPLALGLVSNIGVLLPHAHHHTLVPGSTNDGGEDRTGRVVAGESCLAHSRPIVHNKSCYFVVTHSWFRWSSGEGEGSLGGGGWTV